MNVLHRSIKWVMLVAGLLTCSMFYTALAPVAALRGTFGQTLDGPLAQIIVRNWGALIGLIGLLLIHGAFHPASRRIAMLIAGASKLVFIALVLTWGQQFLGVQLGIAVVGDAIMVLLFAAYLLSDGVPERLK
jgi:hypothetical protein